MATQEPVPVPEGVNKPPGVIVPPVADQVTLLLKEPVPLTVATQVEVLSEVMEEGLATTETPVTVGAGAVTLMAADPATFVEPDCVDVAIQVPVPAPDGVNTPPDVMVPPVAVHVTLLL